MSAARVVVLAAFQRAAPSRLHDLARAFHAGDAAAAREVEALMTAYLAGAAQPGASGEPGDGHAANAFGASGAALAAVAVPGHLAGSANRPVDELLVRLALVTPGLVALPGALVRVADAPSARDADGPRDADAEALTLRWHEHRLPAAEGRVLLVDDVVRTGTTLEAALRAAPAGLRGRIVPLALFRAVD